MDLIFNEKANMWDTEYRIKRAGVISEKIRSLVCINKNTSILDFGAGTGLIGLNFVDQAKDVIFVEQSSEMASVLKSKIERYSKKQCDIYSDLENNDLREKRFDLILSSMVFHHIRNIQEVGNRLYKLLNNGKYLCIVDLMPDDGSFHENEKGFDGYNGFDPLWLSEQFECCGFIYKEYEVFFKDLRNNGKKQFEYSLFILILQK
jgi:ubiquinone/menaquinone biosynthesis C-methylase UbiE